MAQQQDARDINTNYDIMIVRVITNSLRCCHSLGFYQAPQLIRKRVGTARWISISDVLKRDCSLWRVYIEQVTTPERWRSSVQRSTNDQWTILARDKLIWAVATLALSSLFAQKYQKQWILAKINWAMTVLLTLSLITLQRIQSSIHQCVYIICSN